MSSLTSLKSILFLLILCNIVHCAPSIESKQSLGKKGRFFVHTLHSASFFGRTEEVKWSATLKGRPKLPGWLHLVPSTRHTALAYLIGTPVTPIRQLTVHVIAKSLSSAEIKQQLIVINLAEDPKYSSATSQVLDLHIRNYDAETLISDRTGIIGRLETAIKDTFVGKNVNPYIYNIQPDGILPEGKQKDIYRKHKTGAYAEQHRAFRPQYFGSIVSIGTQRGFYSNVPSMVRTLRSKPGFCARNEQVAINKKFQSSFDIDWCQIQLHNLTMAREFADRDLGKPYKTQHVVWAERQPKTSVSPEEDVVQPIEEVYSIWDSILVFPVIAVLCVILVLILSTIFFGRREGQQWRDYKTPSEQLEEYVSVRESQRHLRELSVQRQLLLMNTDRSDSVAPSGIHSFLQPKSRTASFQASNNRLAQYSKSQSRLNADEETTDLLHGSEMVPVGKQTVAEAAKQCGSSMHLYRNPLDSGSDSEGDDNENDSLENEHRRR